MELLIRHVDKLPSQRGVKDRPLLYHTTLLTRCPRCFPPAHDQIDTVTHKSQLEFERDLHDMPSDYASRW